MPGKEPLKIDKPFWGTKGLLIGIILCLGAGWPVMKVGLSVVSPLWMAFFRILITFLVVLVVAGIQKKIRIPKKEEISLVISVGVLQMTVFLALIHVALVYVPPGRSSILAFTTPIWVTPIAVLFGEKLNRLKTIGLILGVLGIVLLFNPMGFDWSNQQQIFGNALLIIAAIAWSIVILHVRFHKRCQPSLDLLFWQSLIAVILIFIAALIWENIDIIISWTFIWTVLFLGIFATAFSYYGMLVVMRKMPSITVSLSLLGIPVVGLVLSALFVREKLNWTIVLSLIFILIGVACISISREDKHSA